MPDTVLSPTQALTLLGVEVTLDGARGARGQAQVRAVARRDNKVVAVTMRDTRDEAITALYRSVSQPPARRTRK